MIQWLGARSSFSCGKSVRNAPLLIFVNALLPIAEQIAV